MIEKFLIKTMTNYEKIIKEKNVNILNVKNENQIDKKEEKNIKILLTLFEFIVLKKIISNNNELKFELNDINLNLILIIKNNYDI